MVRYSLVVRLLHSLHLAAYPGATPSTPHRTGCSLVLSQRSQRELRPLRTSSVASPNVPSPDLRGLLSPSPTPRPADSAPLARLRRFSQPEVDTPPWGGPPVALRVSTAAGR